MESYVDRKPTTSVPLGREIIIELTERCNNNCAHCCINLPANCESARNRELSTGEFLAIIGEAASMGFLAVRFTGGEPLLREDFVELYLSVRRVGMKVRLFTNGTLITPDLADLFARIPPLERIEISLYGMRKESYEATSRTPGSFAAAWRGIQLLLDRNVPLHVTGAMLPWNMKEIDEFRQWAATIPGMDRPLIYSMNFTLRCRRDDEKKNDLIRKLRLSPTDTLAVINTNRSSYIGEMAQFASKFMRPPGGQLFACGIGVCVDPYGYAYPCTELRHPDAGYDLRKGSLDDALNVFFPKLKSLQAANTDYLTRCARCFLKSLCEQCPAKSYSEHGMLDTPVDYFCEVAHAQARCLGLLAQGEKAWEVQDWKKRIENFVTNLDYS